MGYSRPALLDEALSLLAQDGARVLAGGTDLYPATTAQRLAGVLVDVTGIATLRGIARDGSGWRIGAATTWGEIAGADLPPAFDALRAAAGAVGGVQIQTAGTIGGNLCTASPAADGVPPLLVLEAEVALASPRGLRRLPLTAFLTGARRTARGVDEIVTAIHVPDLPGRSAFVKLGARAHLVISIAMVAARIAVADGRITGAAIAVGACGPVATRLAAVEAGLIGAPVTRWTVGDAAVADALAPIDDIRADAAYRRHAAAELVRRAIAQALG